MTGVLNFVGYCGLDQKDAHKILVDQPQPTPIGTTTSIIIRRRRTGEVVASFLIGGSEEED